MSSKREVSMKGVMSLDQVINYLEALVTSIKNGKLVVQHGNEYVALSPSGELFVEVEAEEKKGKEKFNLELSWRKEIKVTKDTELKISSTEPEILIEESDETAEQTEE